MPLLSQLAKTKKIKYFFRDVPKKAKILEVGCGDYWLGKYLKSHGWKNYQGLDLKPPADIIGDITTWPKIGLKPNTFTVIVAFEVVEHVDCFQELWQLLKPDGHLFLTSPVPSMDWLCRILESVGLNQKRTSPHNHLINFKNIPLFVSLEVKTVGLIAQWGKFSKITK